MKRRSQRSIVFRNLLLGIIGAICVGAGGYMLYTEITRSQTPRLLAPNSDAAASTVKRTAAEKTQYTVPPDHPRLLEIEKLKIAAVIVPVTTDNGVLGAPSSAWDVGWYTKSAEPGFGKGALLIDGHVNDALGDPGVFAGLGTLREGDVATIERGDGQRFAYKVVRVQEKAATDVDMGEFQQSADETKEGLNLITCSGVYDAGRQTFDRRILVFAVRAE